MRLLVSVRDASEAIAALEGGADVIDAKEPSRGALGAVDASELRAIVRAVRGERPVSAALGDADDERAVAAAARAAHGAGVSLVKVGLAGVRDVRRAWALLVAATAAAPTVAVAYADSSRAGSLEPRDVLDAAANSGATGVLLDTALKDGGGLFSLMTQDAVRDWIAQAHAAGLGTAIAGKLTEGDLSTVRALGAEVAGLRGAACDGGRTGRISRERVRTLARAIHASQSPSRSPGVRTDTLTPAGSARAK